MELEVIAHMRCDFSAKFGIPRQSGLVEEAEGLVVFTPEYRNPDALRGIEGYSHLWLIWQFSQAVRPGWSPTVRPPRLGGNARMGVFATRSPFRPNFLGLSSVRLVGVEKHREYGSVLRVAGADLMDGTPIFDVKPYLSYTDSHPDALGGFADQADALRLEVDFPPALLESVPEEKRAALRALLSHDPRPAYQRTAGRVYGLEFGGRNIRFTVEGDRLTVIAVEDG